MLLFLLENAASVRPLELPPPSACEEFLYFDMRERFEGY
jgi:hypothetical protein